MANAKWCLLYKYYHGRYISLGSLKYCLPIRIFLTWDSMIEIRDMPLASLKYYSPIRIFLTWVSRVKTCHWLKSFNQRSDTKFFIRDIRLANTDWCYLYNNTLYLLNPIGHLKVLFTNRNLSYLSFHSRYNWLKSRTVIQSEIQIFLRDIPLTNMVDTSHWPP